MKRFFVVATHWSDLEKAQVKYIAGEFSSYVNASIFKTAYSEYYRADAVVVDDFILINY